MQLTKKIFFWAACGVQLDNGVTLPPVQKPPLGGRPNTKTMGDHGTPNAHNC